MPLPFTSNLLPGHFRRLCRLHIRWHHTWRWEKDGRYHAPRARLLKVHHVGSHWPGHLHHGNCCVQGFGGNLPLAHCHEGVAYCDPLVLHSKHGYTVYHYHNSAVHPVHTVGLSLGSNHQGWLLLAELHPSWSGNGCVVRIHGLRSRYPS